MKLETPGTKNKRQAILRGVYEDNLKMKNKAARLQRPPFLRVWGTRVAVVLAGFLIVVSGFQVYQEIQAKQPEIIPVRARKAFYYVFCKIESLTTRTGIISA